MICNNQDCPGTRCDGKDKDFTCPVFYQKYNEELADKLTAAAERVKAMSSEEREAMRIAQRDSYVKAELAAPKANFKWINGVKVYDSYEDYCND